MGFRNISRPPSHTPLPPPRVQPADPGAIVASRTAASLASLASLAAEQVASPALAATALRSLGHLLFSPDIILGLHGGIGGAGARVLGVLDSLSATATTTPSKAVLVLCLWCLSVQVHGRLPMPPAPRVPCLVPSPLSAPRLS